MVRSAKSKEPMASTQKQALSSGYTPPVSSLKLMDSYQPSLSKSDSCESPAKELWSMSAQPLAVGHSRPRSQSYRQSRLSLSIPIAPRHSSIDSITANPVSTISPLTSLPQILPSLGDSNAFLVALAGQERYVFELREELNKAEKELKRLKRYWAFHETSKKNGEMRNIELLRPIQSPGSDEGDINNQVMNANRKFEADKRKELLEISKISKISKETRRTFSGSHARTLSLLSPEKSNFNQSKEPTSLQDQKTTEIDTRRKSLTPVTNRITTELPNRVKTLYSPKNMTIGGKQLVDIAEDVKEGFKAGVLNFFEDLRQVTVGDEGIIKNVTSKNTIADSLINNSRPIAKSFKDKMHNRSHSLIKMTTSPRICDNLIDISPTDETYSDIKSEVNSLQKESLKKQNKSKKLSLAIQTVDELDDPWSNWDSPVSKSPRWSGSTTISSLTTPPDSGYFDQDIKKTGQSLEDSTAILNDGHHWSSLKYFPSRGLGGDLQNVWCGVLKDIENNVVGQHKDRCGPALHQQMTDCVSSPTSNETSIQELLYMSM